MALLIKVSKKRKEKDIDSGAAVGGVVGTLGVQALPSVGMPVANKEALGGVSPEEILEHLPKNKDRKLYKEHYSGGLLLGFVSPDKNNKHSKEEANLIFRTHNLSKNRAGYIPGFTTPDGVDSVVVPEKANEGIIAHELAHSTSRQANSKLGVAAYKLGTLGSMGGILYGATKGSKGEDMSTPETLATIAPSLGYLPEETRANILAGKSIYKLKGGKALMKILPALAVSEASYATLAASPVIANKISKAIKEHKEGQN